MSSFVYKIIVVNLSTIARATNIVVVIIASISLVANEFESLDLKCKLN